MWKVQKGENVYALKIFEKEKFRSQEDVRGLESEIDIMKLLEHPSIIRYEAVFHTSKKLCLVMEYFPFKTLREMLDALPQRRLPEDSAREIFSQILSGVIYCHSKAVIHRDIKAENVLVNPHTLEVRLIDFGLSTVLNSKLKEQAMICGSYNYMAPEVVNRKGFTEQTDIWAMGVLLHLMVAGG